MDKKKLLILLLGLLCVAASAVTLSVWYFSKSSNHDIPQENTENFGFIDDFSCITVTLGEDPKTSVNITWNSLSGGDCRVLLTEAGKDVTEEFPAKEEQYTFSVPKPGQENSKNPELIQTNGSIYRAFISELTPDTTYNYVITRGQTSSGTYSFKTLPDGNDFSFLLISDTQGFTARDFSYFGNVMKCASKRDYDFIIHLGDSVEDGKNIFQWQTYFASADKIMENSIVLNILGNQDKKHVLTHYTYGGPDDNSQTKEYFSFNVGNVHFSVLNTGDGDKDIPKSQLKWLKNDLAESSDLTKIVLIHKAPYSNFNHANDPEIVAIREQITPICKEYGVDAVLEGHDHSFYRGNIDGTVYFMNSSAGIKQHSGLMINTEIPSEKSTIMKNPTYTLVSVTSDSIIFNTYEVSQDGSEKLFDTWSLKK